MFAVSFVLDAIDAYDTTQTLVDPCINDGAKALAAGAFLLGVIDPTPGNLFKRGLGRVGESVGAMQRRGFDPAPYHGTRQSGGKARGPVNGQDALDNSVQASENSTRRVGIDPNNGEFVVFDQTTPGTFHGHVRTWRELSQAHQSALRRQLGVGRKGQLPGGYKQ